MKTRSPENNIALKKLSSLTAFILAAHLAGAQCVSPPSGLVAWWPGEGDARDIIGTNNGALMGGVTFVTGEVGMAFSFDGSSGYIAVSNTSSMDFGTNDFTIAGWIRLSTLDAGPGGGREIIHKSVGSVPGNNNYTYFLEDDPGPPALRFRISDPSSANDLTLAAPLNVGTWYHVAAVRTGNTNQIYLNGSLLGQQVAGDNVDTGTGGIAYIANIAPNGVNITRFFPGQIDELSLFKRALSQNEVEAIYAAASAGMCKDLIFDTSPTGLQWTHNGLQLRLNGPTELGPVVIYASSNLASWAPIFTNPPAPSPIQFLDTSATNAPYQFYRAAQQ